ncbi:hypothetical protein LTS18_007746 [Coniosporium uncinatum]|uniref:Uncharacterized protein n=1 Tax=Coniosporium uncinatum TaxID=93489 RepID=A0ACC3DAQ1_9PEZI|nr:hypothetical protein LTS18_007746 [Coniosporium uncinatum]
MRASTLLTTALLSLVSIPVFAQDDSSVSTMEMTFYSTRTVYRVLTEVSTGTAPSSTPVNSTETITSIGSVVEASATVSASSTSSGSSTSTSSTSTPIYVPSGTGVSNATLSGYAGASGTPAGAPVAFEGAASLLSVNVAIAAIAGGAMLFAL